MKADHICSTVCVNNTHTQTVTPHRRTNRECHDPVNVYHSVILKFLNVDETSFSPLCNLNRWNKKKLTGTLHRYCMCRLYMQLNIEKTSTRIVTEWSTEIKAGHWTAAHLNPLRLNLSSISPAQGSGFSVPLITQWLTQSFISVMKRLWNTGTKWLDGF